MPFVEEKKSKDILDRTRKSFGYQWREFKEISAEDENHFLNYIHPVGPSFFEGKVGLDAACGFGSCISGGCRGSALAAVLEFRLRYGPVGSGSMPHAGHDRTIAREAGSRGGGRTRRVRV